MTLNSQKIKRGGPRPGAGRKPSALTQRFREHYAGSLEELLEALSELALGHYREDSKGRTYRVPPDRASITYILDRLLGRPREEGEAPADLAGLLAELRGNSHAKNT